MPDYSVEEAEVQARKAGAYFGRVLKEHGEGFIAVRVDDTVIVVAVGSHREKLEKAIVKGGALGKDAVIHKAPPVVTGVTLIPMYHAPSDEYPGSRGSVHLHVLSDATVGRRVRKQGECLCSKKHGSRQRMPDGETNMCGECVKVAAEYGIPWSL